MITHNNFILNNNFSDNISFFINFILTNNHVYSWGCSAYQTFMSTKPYCQVNGKNIRIVLSGPMTQVTLKILQIISVY